MDSHTFEQRKRTLAEIMHSMKGVMPPEYKFTLMVRNTRKDGGKDILITEDEPDLVCPAIMHLATMVVLTGGTGLAPSLVAPAPPHLTRVK